MARPHLALAASALCLSSCTLHSWINPRLGALDGMPYPVPVAFVPELDPTPEEAALHAAIADTLRDSQQLHLYEDPDAVRELTAEAIEAREAARARAHADELRARAYAKALQDRREREQLAQETEDPAAPRDGSDAEPDPTSPAADPDAAHDAGAGDPGPDAAVAPAPAAPAAPAGPAPDDATPAPPAGDAFWVPDAEAPDAEAPDSDAPDAAPAATGDPGLPAATAGVAAPEPEGAPEGTPGGVMDAAGGDAFVPDRAVNAEVACTVGARLGVTMVVTAAVKDRARERARVEVSVLRVETCAVHAAFTLSARDPHGISGVAAALRQQAAAQLESALPRQALVTATRWSGGGAARTHAGTRPGDIYAARRNGSTYGVAVVKDVRGGATEFSLLDGKDRIRAGDRLVRSEIDCCYAFALPVSALRVGQDGAIGGIRPGVGVRYRSFGVGRAIWRWGLSVDWFPGSEFSLLGGGPEVGAALSLLPNRVRLGVTLGGAVATSWLGSFGESADATSYGLYATGTVELALRLGHRWWLGIEAGDVRSVGFGGWDLGPDSPVESADELPSLSLRGPIVRLGIGYGPP